MTTREENRIRIVREIPLWGVITGLIAVLMMAGAAAYNQVSGQQRLLDLSRRITDTEIAKAQAAV